MAKIATAIDAVAMQKDAYAAGLYSYTDINEAKKAANASKTDSEPPIARQSQ